MNASSNGVALIAGSSRGLGLLVARELGDRRHTVVLCARDSDELDQAHEQLRSYGLDVHTEVCDVGDHQAVESMVRRIESMVGPIDVLIDVAGIIQVAPFGSLQRGHFAEAVDVMLWGPVNLALAVVPAMRERGHGRIGVVTSIGGMVSVPHLLPYSTAKFGAVGFSQGLRAELAGTGVKVTTIVPGLMRTGSHERAQFSGNQPREYSWFSVGASVPVLAMDAERAARRIVGGVLAGRTMIVLTTLAKLALRIHGIAPATTATVLGIVSRMLPDEPTADQPATLEGRQAEKRLGPGASALLTRITTLGRRAAARFNERYEPPY